MDESRTLVEHFFRHEYGRLVAMLTRSFGIRNIELIEDVVQSVLSKAIQTWGRSGLPDNPGAWLFRSARNLAIDTIRRELTEQRLLHGTLAQHTDLAVSGADSVVSEEVGDESLKLLFLCCHPTIPLESSVAFALKTVSGFSTEELSSAFMISKANVEKRIARAKEKLRAIGTEITELDTHALKARVGAVQSTIYLLFNEGYSSFCGEYALRKDLCEEAIRLTRMLIQAIPEADPSSKALIALMLMHVARFDARVDESGSLVLLEDQDRSQWNWEKIREAMDWMAESATGEQLTRYHVEAAIAWEHCRAKNFHDIDWQKISEYYQGLMHIHPSPMIWLNLAIAVSYCLGPEVGMIQLTEISVEQRKRLRPWWDCALADLYLRLGRIDHAIAHWKDAMLLAKNSSQRELISSRISKAISRQA